MNPAQTSAEPSTEPSANSSPSSVGAVAIPATPAPVKATPATPVTAAAKSEASGLEPITIYPTSHAEARETSARVKQRTGRDVIIAPGYPGIDVEPTPEAAK